MYVYMVLSAMKKSTNALSKCKSITMKLAASREIIMKQPKKGEVRFEATASTTTDGRELVLTKLEKSLKQLFSSLVVL